jgi:3-methyladenine DNA glycosylase AlkD
MRTSTARRESSLPDNPTAKDILLFLKSHASPENVEGMARYGINPDRNYGVCTPVLTGIAKKVKGNHELAQELWKSGIRDARILACFMDDPKKVTGNQMDEWVRDFDSWDICDGCCIHLFSRTAEGHAKAREWSASDREYIKRAGYAMMATLTVHDKTSPDSRFRAYLPLIVKGATDERNYVKKAVNWALRQIGKHSLQLNKEAIRTAERIQRLDSKAARWIASDALRELRSDSVKAMLKKREKRSLH